MRFVNHYRCPQCKKEWSDKWDATCDDDCPHCGCRHISPYRSEDNVLEQEADDGRAPITQQ
jgi:DNA-directed RNA polymerase subunit RPC12/RpoP